MNIGDLYVREVQVGEKRFSARVLHGVETLVEEITGRRGCAKIPQVDLDDLHIHCLESHFHDHFIAAIKATGTRVIKDPQPVFPFPTKQRYSVHLLRDSCTIQVDGGVCTCTFKLKDVLAKKPDKTANAYREFFIAAVRACGKKGSDIAWTKEPQTPPQIKITARSIADKYAEQMAGIIKDGRIEFPTGVVLPEWYKFELLPSSRDASPKVTMYPPESVNCRCVVQDVKKQVKEARVFFGVQTNPHRCKYHIPQFIGNEVRVNPAKPYYREGRPQRSATYADILLKERALAEQSRLLRSVETYDWPLCSARAGSLGRGERVELRFIEHDRWSGRWAFVCEHCKEV